MKYLFSVIIPVYNAEKFLKDSIESVLIQKKTNVEIILINDCSTDNSKKICNYYKKKFSFVNVIHHKKNYGVGISRNDGVKIAKGKYLIFLDSDDCLFKESLNNLENEIQTKKFSDVIIVRYEKITFPNSNYKLIKDNSLKSKNSNKLIKYVLKTKFPFADCWFFVTRREFLLKNKINFPPIRFGESELFVVKIICLMKKYSCMKKKFYDKRDRDSSLNHLKDYNATLSTLILLIEFCTFVNNYKLSKTMRYFTMSYIQDAFGIFISLLILRNNSEIKRISKIINSNINNLKFLKKSPENLSISDYFKNYGSFLGLKKFRNDIINSKINSLKPLLSSFKYFFCYCRSKYSESTIKLLHNNKIKILGIIDDNERFKDTNFLQFKTINSQYFFKKNKNRIGDCAIIISHQRESTAKKIIKNLKFNGLKINQIQLVKY